MNPPSVVPGQPLAMATAAGAVPQLQSLSALDQASAGGAQLPAFPGANSSLPLPKKASRKRKTSTRPESSNASLEAAINSLRSDFTSGPSALPHGPTAPAGSFSAAGIAANIPAAAGFTANIPAAAFGRSAFGLAQGSALSGATPHNGPAVRNMNTHSFTAPPAATTAPGQGSAALELSLLLTTLQSLANVPEEQGQPLNTIASNSYAAQGKLRDWLAQLQQHANDTPSETVSH